MIFLWIYIIGLPIAWYLLYKDGLKVSMKITRLNVTTFALVWPVTAAILAVDAAYQYLSKEIGK